MKTVVNISGGAGSTEAFFRCLDQGRDVVPVFADTMSETPELYQLLDDIERISGMKIHRLSSGRNIWDVFNEFGVIRIAKTQTCKASFELKKKPLANFTQKRWSPEECVIATGLSWMEKDRQERLVAAMDPYQPYFPLNERPLLSQCELIDKLKERGITTQSLYEKGYPHNNCAGACVLAGIKQWAGLYHDNPSLFANAEQREQAWQAKHKSDFTNPERPERRSSSKLHLAAVARGH